MKIVDITATAHHIEVPLPLFTKNVVTRRIVFAQVKTDEGITGYGLTGGQFLPWSVVAALENDFLEVVRGMDPRDTEAIHEKVWWALNMRTFTGVVSFALSALDIACWDIKGKASGRTVAQMLGGARDWAPIYVTFGFPIYDRQQLVEAAKIQVDRGIKRLKMVVGVHPDGWAEDARRVRAVREAIGPDVELMLDANYKFSPIDAKLFCRAVEDCGIVWFEEPLYANDVRALADLRRATSIPIAAGQMEGHRWRLRELIEHQAVDILQPNVCYNGGYTETQKVAHMAQAFNVQIANGGGWPLYNLHTMAGLMNGWRVEFHLGMQEVGERIFIDPPKPEGNIVRVGPKPGVGLEPNFDALAACQMKR
ncbi:MAG TPA: mandelate racemase/muconate lactonizing enzyme family protein [Thermodesulfobacteriota bacterium]